jgi:hypothetical protein
MVQVLLPTAVPRDALTEPGHKVIGGWGATIVGNQAELIDAELVEQCDQLRGDAGLSVVAHWPCPSQACLSTVILIGGLSGMGLWRWAFASASSC